MLLGRSSCTGWRPDTHSVWHALLLCWATLLLGHLLLLLVNHLVVHPLHLPLLCLPLLLLLKVLLLRMLLLGLPLLLRLRGTSDRTSS